MKLTFTDVSNASPAQVNDLIDIYVMKERMERSADYPNWSGDILAAFEVLDKFPHWKITLNKNRVDNRVYIETETGHGYFAKQMPIPEAICRAVLIALLEEIELKDIVTTE